ncbi:hypothetical protein WJX73_002217 [Symbiochloris irregularis]|uniref:U3 small nucleolar RNA-associated protein 13 C-terminal domain-containing protein n=1 Tax=Symbiochloris irregularis TaxID=706552 RepID=A0AAW1PLP8_9CHLO
MASDAGLREAYEPTAKLEQFYSGGALTLLAGGLIACACEETIKVVDRRSGAVKFTLPGDGSAITALACSPKGDRIYTASRGLQLTCWSTSTCKAVRTWKTPKAPVVHLTVDASGGLLGAGSADGNVRVYDTDGFFCTHSFHAHSGVVLQVVFQSQQLWLISAGDDGSIVLYDLVAKKRLAALKGHFSAVTALALTPNGWGLLSAGRDKTAMLWDLRSHARLATIPLYEAVEGAVVLPPSLPVLAPLAPSLGKDHVAFAVGGERGRLSLWRTDTSQCILPQPSAAGSTAAAAAAQAGEEITHVQLEGAGELLVCSGDGRLSLYDLQAATPQPASSLPSPHTLVSNLDEVTDLRLMAPDPATRIPSRLAVATNSPHVYLFDISHNADSAQSQQPQGDAALEVSCAAVLRGHDDIILALDVARGADGTGDLLASGGKDAKVCLWDTRRQVCVAASVGHAGSVTALAFSRRSAGKWLVSGGADKLLKVWDTSALVQAVGSDEARDAGKPGKLQAITAVATHDKEINAVTVSPNDALLCSASQDRTAKVWKLPELVLQLTLRGHKRGVWAAQFAPRDRVAFLSGGAQLMSTGADGLLKLWSVQSSECTATLDSHEGKVWALDTPTTSSDAFLASGAADGSLVIWRDCTAEKREERAQEAVAGAQSRQALANALQAEDFEEAARLAFQLNQPARLLSVITAAMDRGRDRCETLLRGLAGAWDVNQLATALAAAAKWNTNGRHCHAAHALLRAIFLEHPLDDVEKVRGIGDTATALAAYTQRHLARMDRLLRASYLLDYTLERLHVLTPLDTLGGPPLQQAAEKDAAVAPATPEHSSEPPQSPMVAAVPSALRPAPAAHTDEAQLQGAGLAGTPHTNQEASAQQADAHEAPLGSGAGAEEASMQSKLGAKQGSTAKKRRSEGRSSTGKRSKKQAALDDGSAPVGQAEPGPTPPPSAVHRPAAHAATSVETPKGSQQVRKPGKAKGNTRSSHKPIALSSVKKGKGFSDKQNRRTSL